MWIRPSKVYYSQKSISNVFIDEYTGYETPIGVVVDDIYEGRQDKRDFPRIGVSMIHGRWYAHDNRRLWLFRTLEMLGRCNQIPVYVIDYMPEYKMTTQNGGSMVVIRGDPGGYWQRRVYDYCGDSDSDDSEYDDYGLHGNFGRMTLY